MVCMLGLFFMHVGVSGVLFFCQFAVKRFFPKIIGTSATASAAARGSIPPVPAQYARSKHYGRQRVRLVGSVSGYGVAWGVKKMTDREMGDGQGSRLRWPLFFLIHTTINQKITLVVGGILETTCNLGGTCRGGRFGIVWGGELVEEKLKN
jgi:hypothetical protein